MPRAPRLPSTRLLPSSSRPSHRKAPRPSCSPASRWANRGGRAPACLSRSEAARSRLAEAAEGGARRAETCRHEGLARPDLEPRVLGPDGALSLGDSSWPNGETNGRRLLAGRVLELDSPRGKRRGDWSRRERGTSRTVRSAQLDRPLSDQARRSACTSWPPSTRLMAHLSGSALTVNRNPNRVPLEISTPTKILATAVPNTLKAMARLGPDTACTFQ